MYTMRIFLNGKQPVGIESKERDKRGAGSEVCYDTTKN
jgi:hypothetical protein